MLVLIIMECTESLRLCARVPGSVAFYADTSVANNAGTKDTVVRNANASMYARTHRWYPSNTVI